MHYEAENLDTANLATTAEANVIKAVDKTTIHKICSGQVVLSLATAVKELVENSIDAGARNIDIKLGDYGSSFVEVSDDGSGIEKENFQALSQSTRIAPLCTASLKIYLRYSVKASHVKDFRLQRRGLRRHLRLPRRSDELVMRALRTRRDDEA